MSGDTPRLRPTTGRRISAWAAISVLIVAAGAFAKGDWFAAESASHPSNPGPVQEVLAAQTRPDVRSDAGPDCRARTRAAAGAPRPSAHTATACIYPTTTAATATTCRTT